jgi:hypothetical protein
VKFLITDRRLGVKSKGVGARLLDFAKEVTRREQIKLLRVDCWSGGNGGLIRYVAMRLLVAIVEITLAFRYYESQGFVRDKFLQYPDKHNTGRDWTGWVFELWM